MQNFKQNTSYSYSRYDGAKSVHSINGADTFLSRFSTKNNFDITHGKIMDTMHSNLAKSTHLRENLGEDLDEVQKFDLLNKENKVLRTSLRDVNDYLTKFLEMLKDNKLRKMHSMGYKYGSHGKLKKTKDELVKYRDQEAVNYSKMLKNMEEEHTRVKQRVFQVQDHKYVINLRAQVKESQKIIKELKDQNTFEKNRQFTKEK